MAALVWEVVKGPGSFYLITVGVTFLCMLQEGSGHCCIAASRRGKEAKWGQAPPSQSRNLYTTSSHFPLARIRL